MDAPGHKGYVQNMIGGAVQADVAVLVISARKGEFETGFDRGGQTREHAQLARTMGLRKLLVVVNKMDEPTVQWSKERYDEILDKLRPFLKASGYNLQTEVDFMPISGFTGANLKDRIKPEVCPWHSGPSFLEYLDEIKPIERRSNAPFLMPVSDKYREMGTVVSGRIESGMAQKGQQVLLMPNRRSCEVVSVMVDEVEVPVGRSGDNVSLRLKGIEEEVPDLR